MLEKEKINNNKYLKNNVLPFLNDENLCYNKEANEGDTMSNNKYLSNREFDLFKQKTEFDIQGMEDRLTSKIDLISAENSNKFELLRIDMKNMLLEEREEQRKQKTDTNRFLIGTIFFSSVGLFVSILSLFF